MSLSLLVCNPWSDTCKQKRGKTNHVKKCRKIGGSHITLWLASDPKSWNLEDGSQWQSHRGEQWASAAKASCCRGSFASARGCCPCRSCSLSWTAEEGGMVSARKEHPKTHPTIHFIIAFTVEWLQISTEETEMQLGMLQQAAAMSWKIKGTSSSKWKQLKSQTNLIFQPHTT